MEKNEAEIATWLEEGNNFVKLSRYGEALECYSKALKFKSKDTESFFNSFESYYGTLLNTFKGTKNTKDVLIKKGGVFAQLFVILISRNTVGIMALIRFYESVEPKSKAIARIEGKADIVSSEIALFYISLIDRISFNNLPSKQRIIFMKTLCLKLKEMLPYFPYNDKMDPSKPFVVETFNLRMYKYNNILDAMLDAKEKTGDTLFYNDIVNAMLNTKGKTTDAIEEKMVNAMLNVKEKIMYPLFYKLENNILITTGATEDSISLVDTKVIHEALFAPCMISFDWISENLLKLIEEQ